jgi:transcriptional antiterminator NusG
MAKSKKPQQDEQAYDDESTPLDLTPNRDLKAERAEKAGYGDGEKPPTIRDHEKRWYVVHCYSGHENKVKQAIFQRIQTMNMKDLIFDVLIPTAEEIEVKDGKQKKVEKRVFPGYILVEMKMNEDSWYVVRNTSGVTGFVGMGDDPTPLEDEEVRKIMQRMENVQPIVRVNFKLGDKVRIINGPFNDIHGVVFEIQPDKNKVRVMVNFFGRDTPVDVDFLEVEKL